MSFVNSIRWYIYAIKKNIRNFLAKHGSLEIENHGLIKIRKNVWGKNNSLIVGKDTLLDNVIIFIRGNNNRIIFGENCKVHPKSSFWAIGNNITITIGDGTTFNHSNHVNAQEDGSIISIGNNCMISNQTIIRTSDSHPIIDLETGERLNYPKPVIIGNNVWIAPHSEIMKGARIGDGSIIGSETMVSKEIPSNCLAVGRPAKVVKIGISWKRNF